jgi:hypothetical protein
VVVIGAGTGRGHWVQWLMQRDCKNVVLIEGEDASFAALLTTTASREGWLRRQEVVADRADSHRFHTLSVSTESGLLPPEALQTLWPNLTVREVKQKAAVTLSEVLALRDAQPANWLVIDCWPALPLLRTLDEAALLALDVVVLRTWLGATPHSLLGQQDLNAELEMLGFKQLVTTSGRHPEIGHTLMWRARPVTESSVTPNSPDIIQRADGPMAALDPANDVLGANRANLKLAFELYQAEIAKLLPQLAEPAEQRQQPQRALVMADLETQVEGQSSSLSKDVVLQALQDALSQLHSKQQETMKETEHRLRTDCNNMLTNAVRQLEAFIGIQNFMATGESLTKFHGWPISPDLGLFLLERIKTYSYDLIIEFGSGTSTLLFAKALSMQTRDGCEPENWKNHPLTKRLMSFEHDAKYHGDTHRRLGSTSGAATADLIHAPLVDWCDDTGSYRFYDCDAPLRAVSSCLGSGKARILVLVDGPPGKTCAKARYPAVPHVFSRLGRHHIDVVLDDANRSDEKAVIELWRTFWRTRGVRFEESTVALEKGLYLAST